VRYCREQSLKNAEAMRERLTEECVRRKGRTVAAPAGCYQSTFANGTNAFACSDGMTVYIENLR